MDAVAIGAAREDELSCFAASQKGLVSGSPGSGMGLLYGIADGSPSDDASPRQGRRGGWRCGCLVGERYVSAGKEKAEAAGLWRLQFPEVSTPPGQLRQVGHRSADERFGLVQREVPFQLQFAGDQDRVSAKLHRERRTTRSTSGKP